MKTCPLCDQTLPDSLTHCPSDGAMLVGLCEYAPGFMIARKYRIERKIGQGGMGTVYLAEDTYLNAAMALKFLSKELSSDPSFTRRFRDEARATFRLRHPNIVEVTGLDQAEDGSLFIAMEYIEGSSLRTLLGSAGAPFDIPRALNLTAGIASGLGAAHKAGFVHRDVKPENIVVCERDGHEQPKILDFGIVASMAQAKADEAEQERLSRAPILTAKYAAPEQWGFMRPDELDGRTDLYALGCVFYEMLAGRPPFTATSYEGWMAQHLTVEPVRPSTFNPEIARYPRLDELVLWLLQKKREHRPSSAQEFIAGLESVRAAGPGPGQPVSRAAVPPPPMRPVAPPVFTAGSSTTAMETPGARLNASLPRGERTIVDQPYRPVAPPQPPAVGASGGGSRTGLILGALALVLLVLVGVGFFALRGYQDGLDKKAHEEPTASIDNTPPRVQPVTPQPIQPGTVPVSAPAANTAGTPPPTGNVTPAKAAAVTPLAVPKVATPTSATLSVGDLTKQATTAYAQHDYAAAGKAFTRACALHSATSCRQLADMYAKQQGFANDPVKVADLRTQSCDEGDVVACYQLSFNYKTGDGVAKDNTKVESLRAKSCNGGYAEACTKLGALYLSEEGLKDPVKAAQFFDKGCAKGSREGCWFSGMTYKLGTGVTKNTARAGELFQKSCLMGYAQACEEMKKL